MDRKVTRTLIGLTALTVTLLAVTVTFAGPVAPGPALPSRVVLRGVPISEPLIALTIDDGPSAAFTPEVLAVLKRHGAEATFFVVGRRAEARPDLVLAAERQGCEIGSHTWSHPFLNRIGSVRATREIERGASALGAITGRPPLYFRPPRGKVTTAAIEAARAGGMRTVLWDACLDHSADRTPEEAVDRVMTRLGPGDVVLLHDGGGDAVSRARTVAALDLLLTRLEARGYRFVTLSDLYRAGRVRL